MTLYAYLRNIPEDIPDWLINFEISDGFSRQRFFSSRVVYYPGSWLDGHPVELFGSTHTAHCFIYADYMLSRNDLEAELADPEGRFRGYQTLARIELTESDLVPGGWEPHIRYREMPWDLFYRARMEEAPFVFLEVLERTPEFGEDHGPSRLALIFLRADAIAAYDALFCQGNWNPRPFPGPVHRVGPNDPFCYQRYRNTQPFPNPVRRNELIGPPFCQGNQNALPFAVIIQDDGFNLNYDRFGGGGLLETIAHRAESLPEYLLVAEHNNPWESYDRVPHLEGDRGGMHNTLRFLYRFSEETARENPSRSHNFWLPYFRRNRHR